MSDDQPILRIAKGDATPEEIAALVAVIASMGGAAPAATKPRSSWADPARALRPVLRHGPGGWRASGLPR
ncbi:MAG: acyl-CoA carboxylase subunit epsilon [Nocardioides sp.]